MYGHTIILFNNSVKIAGIDPMLLPYGLVDYCSLDAAKRNPGKPNSGSRREKNPHLKLYIGEVDTTLKSK